MALEQLSHPCKGGELYGGRVNPSRRKEAHDSLLDVLASRVHRHLLIRSAAARALKDALADESIYQMLDRVVAGADRREPPPHLLQVLRLRTHTLTRDLGSRRCRPREQIGLRLGDDASCRSRLCDRRRGGWCHSFWCRDREMARRGGGRRCWRRSDWSDVIIVKCMGESILRRGRRTDTISIRVV